MTVDTVFIFRLPDYVDPDDTEVTFKFSNLPVFAQTKSSNIVFRPTSNPDSVGTYKVKIRLTDSTEGMSMTKTYILLVNVVDVPIEPTISILDNLPTQIVINDIANPTFLSLQLVEIDFYGLVHISANPGFKNIADLLLLL